ASRTPARIRRHDKRRLVVPQHRPLGTATSYGDSEMAHAGDARLATRPDATASPLVVTRRPGRNPPLPSRDSGHSANPVDEPSLPTDARSSSTTSSDALRVNCIIVVAAH